MTEEKEVTKKETPPAPATPAVPATPVTYRMFQESMSPTVGKLALALSKAQGECENGSKDKQGFNYKYMTLPNLIDIIRPTLVKNELAIIQSHELVKGPHATVVTHTTIIHGSGEWHKSSIEVMIHAMPQLSGAQMEGVSATYGRRYALQALMLIAAEDDTDGTKNSK